MPVFLYRLEDEVKEYYSLIELAPDSYKMLDHWKRKIERGERSLFYRLLKELGEVQVYILSIMGRVDRLGRLYLGHRIQAGPQFQSPLNSQCLPQELMCSVVQDDLQLHRQRH
jgi:hypothetical protein